MRTAYIALRIGKELHLPDTDMRDLYKASLLKDAGCSSNAVRVYKVFAADDLLTLTPLIGLKGVGFFSRGWNGGQNARVPSVARAGSASVLLAWRQKRPARQLREHARPQKKPTPLRQGVGDPACENPPSRAE